VTYDSTVNQDFVVHKADSTIRVFRPSKKGHSLLMLRMMSNKLDAF